MSTSAKLGDESRGLLSHCHFHKKVYWMELVTEIGWVIWGMLENSRTWLLCWGTGWHDSCAGGQADMTCAGGQTDMTHVLGDRRTWLLCWGTIGHDSCAGGQTDLTPLLWDSRTWLLRDSRTWLLRHAPVLRRYFPCSCGHVFGIFWQGNYVTV